MVYKLEKEVEEERTLTPRIQPGGGNTGGPTGPGGFGAGFPGGGGPGRPGG